MLVIDFTKCSGCRRCESHCSFFHSGRTGHFGSRIKVEKIESIGVDYPVVCVQCDGHYCTKCPHDAISITERGSIEVSPTLCTQCGACETLCPIGAIQVYRDVPHVCDLCGGAPRCVAACEMGAITYEPDIRQAVSLDDIRKTVKKLTPAQKRYETAVRETRAMRDTWLKERKGA